MPKDDIVGVLGTILSSILAFLGYLWSVGALQLIFTFLTGAFATYVVQHRLAVESEKRKIKRENAIEMRELVYGPMYMDLSQICDGIRSLAHPEYDDYESIQGLKDVRQHYLFFTIKPELRQRLSHLLDMLEKYQGIQSAAEAMLREVIFRETKKEFERMGIDAHQASSRVILRLNIGKIMVSATDLMRTLFMGITPADFKREETEKWGRDLAVEVQIGDSVAHGDVYFGMNDIDQLHANSLSEAQKEPIFTEEKEQRKRVIAELEALLEQLKVFMSLG